jgi:4-carboxymuconolactone decarboxylase
VADETLYNKGMTVRRQVLGDEYVDKATADADDFNRDFQRLVTQYCWGEVWTRSVLTNKQRSLNNLCMIAALNRAHEFELHVRGAIRNGCTPEEIQEVLLQAAIYCGVPAAMEAFRVTEAVLAELEDEERSGDGAAVRARSAE